MTPEELAARQRMLGGAPTQEDAARLRLLGAGGAGMAGQLKAGRQNYLDTLEADAMGAPPAQQPIQTAPMPPQAQVAPLPQNGSGEAANPAMQRAIADKLRQLFSRQPAAPK
jgi:hypothetical protein